MLTHLHTHTSYSVLDGVAAPDDYFDVAAERGYSALAITEHGNLASVPSNYWASKRTGVKYIVGCELYYNDYELERQKLEADGLTQAFDNEQKNKYLKHRHLLVLCKTMDGYRNLLRIRRESYERGFYRKPRAFFELLQKHREGLIIGSACMNGPICFEIMRYLTIKDDDRYTDIIKNGVYKDAIRQAWHIAKQFKEVFKDDFYIELQMPGIEHDVELFRWLVDIAEALGIKCILTNDAHYINEKDYAVQRVMMAIDQNTTVDDPELFITNSSNGYFKTRIQLRDTFRQSYSTVSEKVFDAACDTTMEVAEKCRSFTPDTEPKLSQIEDADNKLKQLTLKGLEKNGLIHNKRYVKQALHELNRIIEKEFASYFLICRDLVMESRRLGMPVGPRGSAAGSLVCYLIGIHNIDPLIWSLSFDRFLGTARGGRLLQVNMDNDIET